MSASERSIQGPDIRMVFECSLQVLCVIDFQGTIRLVNPAVRRMLGYEPHQLVGVSVPDLAHPADLPLLKARMARLIRGKQVPSFETRFRHRDKSWRWLLWNAAPSPQDAVIYAAATDITEKRRYLEERFRRLFETSKDGMMLLDAETGIISDINPHLLSMTGYPREDLVGKALPVAPAFAESGLGVRILNELRQDPVFRCESRLERKDGSFIYAELLCNRYKEDDHDAIQCNVMSGEEAYPELKAIRPDLPILISSGYSEQMARERFDVPVEGFIQKPYTGAELVRKIQSLLAAHRSPDMTSQ